MKELPTTREIAKRVGCSHVTVSRALKNNSSVNKDMKERILAVAKEMGYRPNPLLSSFMSTRAMKRKIKGISSSLAWLNTHPNKQFWSTHAYTRNYLEGARERAAELGYALDEIWVVEPGNSPKRLQQILTSRGIFGLVLPASYIDIKQLEVDWNQFSVVCIGPQTEYQLPWHRVTLAIGESMQICIDKLVHKGFERIALALPLQSEQISLAYEGAFRFFLHRYPDQLLGNILIYDRKQAGFEDLLAKWLHEEQPDALICLDSILMEICRAEGISVPAELSLVHLRLAHDVEGWAGINPFERRQSSVAVDLVTSHVQRNERGVPTFPKMVQIFGEWQEGWTCENSDK